MKHHRLAAFFVLAFALSWYPWILALLRGRTSGPNPLGPLAAAIIVTAIVYGRSGLRWLRLAKRWPRRAPFQREHNIEVLPPSAITAG